MNYFQFMKTNTQEYHKQEQPKEGLLQYFQSLQAKLLQESDKLTNLMGKSLIHDKSIKRLKFALSPNKLQQQDSFKNFARLSVKTEANKAEPAYMKRVKQLYQKIKNPIHHFEENLKPIKQLAPKEKSQGQKKLTYNLLNKSSEIKEQNVAGVTCQKEKLTKSSKSHKPFIESQSLKETISTQSCKSFKLMSEQSIHFFAADRISIHDFEVLNFIAKGKLGQVYTVRHKRSNFLCALKKIPRSVFSKDSKMLTQRIREIKIQSFLDHPNIVQLYSVFTDESNLYLLMQLCSSGTLYQHLKAEGRFAEDKIRNVVRQVCHAVQYMHDNDILHRDLKPENILFHQNIVKICDFDWSVNSPLLRTTHCGSPVYTSPQIVQGQQYDNKVDIWNIGILVYELLYGRVPFEVRSEEDLCKIVDDDIYFPRSKPASPEIKSFILGCLQKSPKERFTIARLIDHQFLNQRPQTHRFS